MLSPSEAAHRLRQTRVALLSSMMTQWMIRPSREFHLVSNSGPSSPRSLIRVRVAGTHPDTTRVHRDPVIPVQQHLLTTRGTDGPVPRLMRLQAEAPAVPPHVVVSRADKDVV